MSHRRGDAAPLRGDTSLTLSAVAVDALRPFFAIGYVSFALMAPLAATSTVGMIRRLGGPRWQALHRLVYPAAISGVVHTYWPWTTHAPRYAVLQSHPRRARGPCVRANAICYTAFRSLTRPCEVAKR